MERECELNKEKKWKEKYEEKLNKRKQKKNMKARNAHLNSWETKLILSSYSMRKISKTYKLPSPRFNLVAFAGDQVLTSLFVNTMFDFIMFFIIFFKYQGALVVHNFSFFFERSRYFYIFSLSFNLTLCLIR